MSIENAYKVFSNTHIPEKYITRQEADEKIKELVDDIVEKQKDIEEELDNLILTEKDNKIEGSSVSADDKDNFYIYKQKDDDPNDPKKHGSLFKTKTFHIFEQQDNPIDFKQNRIKNLDTLKYDDIKYTKDNEPTGYIEKGYGNYSVNISLLKKYVEQYVNTSLHRYMFNENEQYILKYPDFNEITNQENDIINGRPERSNGENPTHLTENYYIYKIGTLSDATNSDTGSFFKSKNFRILNQQDKPIDFNDNQINKLKTISTDEFKKVYGLDINKIPYEHKYMIDYAVNVGLLLEAINEIETDIEVTTAGIDIIFKRDLIGNEITPNPYSKDQTASPITDFYLNNILSPVNILDYGNINDTDVDVDPKYVINKSYLTKSLLTFQKQIETNIMKIQSNTSKNNELTKKVDDLEDEINNLHPSGDIDKIINKDDNKDVNIFIQDENRFINCTLLHIDEDTFEAKGNDVTNDDYPKYNLYFMRVNDFEIYKLQDEIKYKIDFREQQANAHPDEISKITKLDININIRHDNKYKTIQLSSISTIINPDITDKYTKIKSLEIVHIFHVKYIDDKNDKNYYVLYFKIHQYIDVKQQTEKFLHYLIYIEEPTDNDTKTINFDNNNNIFTFEQFYSNINYNLWDLYREGLTYDAKPYIYQYTEDNLSIIFKRKNSDQTYDYKLYNLRFIPNSDDSTIVPDLKDTKLGIKGIDIVEQFFISYYNNNNTYINTYFHNVSHIFSLYSSPGGIERQQFLISYLDKEDIKNKQSIIHEIHIDDNQLYTIDKTDYVNNEYFAYQLRSGIKHDTTVFDKIYFHHTLDDEPMYYTHETKLISNHPRIPEVGEYKFTMPYFSDKDHESNNIKFYNPKLKSITIESSDLLDKTYLIGIFNPEFKDINDKLTFLIFSYETSHNKSDLIHKYIVVIFRLYHVYNKSDNKYKVNYYYEKVNTLTLDDFIETTDTFQYFSVENDSIYLKLICKTTQTTGSGPDPTLSGSTYYLTKKIPFLKPLSIDKHAVHINTTHGIQFMDKYNYIRPLTTHEGLEMSTIYPNSVFTNQLHSRKLEISDNTGDYIYMIGGKDDEGRDTTLLQRYNPYTKTWKDLANMNKEKAHFNAVTLNGKIYAVGGNGKGSIDRYDPITNKWVELLPIGKNIIGSGVTVLNDKIYIMGGEYDSADGDEKYVIQYDPYTNNLKNMKNMLRNRVNFNAVTLNGYIYAVGGYEKNTPYGNTPRSVERYDPITNQWKYMSDMNEKRMEFAVILLDGYIYAIGGDELSKTPGRTAERYDPTNDQWDEIAIMTTPRKRHNGVAFDGNIYIFGGIDYNASPTQHTSIERYDPTDNKWEIYDNMNSAIYWQGMTTTITQHTNTITRDKIYNQNSGIQFMETSILPLTNNGELSTTNIDLGSKQHTWNNIYTKKLVTSNPYSIDYIYVFGTYNETWTYDYISNEFENIYPRTSDSSDKKSEYLSYMGSTYYNNKIYVVWIKEISLGPNKIIIQAYDPYTNKWNNHNETITKFEIVNAAITNSITIMDGIIYMLGYEENGDIKLIKFNIDLDVSWEDIDLEDSKIDYANNSDFSKIQGGMTIVGLNNKLYIIGGGLTPMTDANDNIQIYDINEKKWSFENMNYKRMNPSTIVYNNEIYIFGGNVKDDDISDEKISTDDGFKRIKLNSKYPFFKIRSSTIFNDEMYTFGANGNDGKSVNGDMYKYTFSSSTWSKIENISLPSSNLVRNTSMFVSLPYITKTTIEDNKIYNTTGLEFTDDSILPIDKDGELTSRKLNIGSIENPFDKGFFNGVYIGSSEVEFKEDGKPSIWFGYFIKDGIQFKAELDSSESPSWRNEKTSIFSDNNILTKRAFVSTVSYTYSDKRIKTNIEDVPDNLALQQVRNLPCRYYNYKDFINQGTHKTIGYIAQEVKEVLPMAVQEFKKIIPNEYYHIQNPIWEEIGTNENIKYNLILSSNDFKDDTFMDENGITHINGIKYEFIVSNDLSHNTTNLIITGNNDNRSFTFEQKWKYIFIYGREINDFLVIDKQKICALHHASIQEIDRIQIENINKIKVLEEENKRLKAEIEKIKTFIGMT